jgi:cytochrome oxidase Cu insertion factor (SCO1/SenC/PrrC family)
MRIFLFVLTTIALVVVLLTGIRLWLAKPATETALPALAMVPEFQLTDQAGATITREDLHGKVWVAAFIFTRCTVECPMLIGSLKGLQGWVAEEENVRLVSFTVDPEFDTPEVLAGYAREIGADTSRWIFVTGQRDSIYRLAREGFLLGVSPAESTGSEGGAVEIPHSQRLVLVDARGRIRGYYTGLDLSETTRLRADTRRILAEERL